MTEHEDGDDAVVVAGGWHSICPPHHGNCDIVIPASAFDADLGMTTHAAVCRQLMVDVPRSRVVVEGHETQSWRDVYRAAWYPRMCTQAVLAPVVEWLHRHGVLVNETRHPLIVIVRGGDVVVHKRLGICDWNDGCIVSGQGETDVFVHGTASHVIVSVCIRRFECDSLSSGVGTTTTTRRRPTPERPRDIPTTRPNADRT